MISVTKNRRQVVAGEHLTATGTDHVRDVRADFDADLTEFNGEDDHLQVLVEYPPTVQFSRLVNSLEGGVPGKLRRQYRARPHRNALLSPSHVAAACGGAPLSIILQYLEQQRRPD
ncbi:transposase [Rhodococcus marinonascens]|uniref:transposase n=1 Tax=Rhodococcus marinonascens TaxID=38311 RepID=UPI000A067E05|nr:transposase [Rhodococcus marinonascens]